MDRGAFLFGAMTMAAASAASAVPVRSLADLEKRYGGRLGVAALDSGSGSRIAHRASERFPMCSTFKMMLVGQVLSRVDAGRERLDRHIGYTKSDLLAYAPVTRANVHRGSMSVESLCSAAVEYSDNTAANLLLRAVGGPGHYTAYARSLGDTVTRLDRYETMMSAAVPGDVRDTTSPDAMMRNARLLLTGSALAPASRQLLASWMAACKTSSALIRAGVPAHWRVEDKTGSGGHATRNDVAALYPPRRSPIFIAAYYTESSATAPQRDAMLAQVGRLVASTFA